MALYGYITLNDNIAFDVTMSDAAVYSITLSNSAYRFQMVVSDMMNRKLGNYDGVTLGVLDPNIIGTM